MGWGGISHYIMKFPTHVNRGGSLLQFEQYCFGRPHIIFKCIFHGPGDFSDISEISSFVDDLSSKSEGFHDFLKISRQNLGIFHIC